MARQKINFITIAVDNLQKSIEFYHSVFGFRTEGPKKGSEEHCIIELDDDFMLVLYRRKEFLEITADPKQKEKSAGFILSHNAQSKEEVQDILRLALQSGGKQAGQPLDEDWGYSISFADPDNHQWEVVHMP